MDDILNMQSGKMLSTLSVPIQEKTFDASWNNLCASKNQQLQFLCLKSGINQESLLETVGRLLGDYSTLVVGEYPSVEKESHLCSVLETNAPQTYYLKKSECQGILDRVKFRGKTLPMEVLRALNNTILIQN